jgi:hypothetical protein
MLFLFAYGDIFGYLKPGQIQDVMGGEIGGFAIAQGFLLAISIYITIASLMVFLTLVLKPAISRWTNIVLAALYIVSIAASVVGEWAYFWFLSAAESALLVLVIWYAWTWPASEPAANGS